MDFSLLIFVLWRVRCRGESWERAAWRHPHSVREMISLLSLVFSLSRSTTLVARLCTSLFPSSTAVISCSLLGMMLI